MSALHDELRRDVPGVQHLTPCGKFRYADAKAARTAANYRKHDHKFKRGKTKHLRAYQCPDCGGWHLTKNRAWSPRLPH